MNNTAIKPSSLALKFLILLFLAVTPVLAQDQSTEALPTDSLSDTPTPPAPATGLTATDIDDDSGGRLHVKWQLSADDDGDGEVVGYRIMRSESVDGPWEEAGVVPAGRGAYTANDLDDGIQYYFKVVTLGATPVEGSVTEALVAESEPVGPVQSSAQWFDGRRINVVVVTAVVSLLIIFFIQRAKAGQKLTIRKIAGLEAVDEAVGRATEMGRKIYFVPGINDMDNVQTIAGLTILGRVAELAAQYDTWLEVPVCRSLVMVTAKEVVQEAFTKAGRPDSYQETQVHYLTDDQFGYAAAIDGMVVREKPATIFYMGAFFAESLILAETGNASGAIQIAGTAMPAQLPFFVTACDYTLIGEELFAASAYLSKEPRLLGSLKGQDFAKALFLLAIIVGVLVETFIGWNFSSLLSVD